MCCRASVRVVLCNGRWWGIRLAVGGPGRTRRGGFFSTLFTLSLRVQVLPLPALHGPAFFAPRSPRAHPLARRATPLFSNSMTASTTDHLLRFKRWRELCRAPASPPSFDQRTTRRLPRLWRFLFLVGFLCATPPRPRFFVAFRLLCL